MSCEEMGPGEAAGSDCSEVLHRVYEYLDGEMTTADTVKIKQHLEACGPCLHQYDLDQALKALVKRSCACEEAPVELRTSIMARITTIRYEISE
ncbi:mycothiol system anti-sigma-R factor [Pedococcus dokdonensis]|uniref:Mycothiol system anti-sigma-R factor n=1 Tax=Pedococcus dokdonensis TaxID=443156 RepID=A0A1H0L8W3_9MICO|nr:mycothiol system anti-sigma-R factor [Pedococcus dokdonensis]SDO64443.1 mycothiol system anti-sigma-R factor [Pedococcus dokdonensis]